MIRFIVLGIILCTAATSHAQAIRVGYFIAPPYVYNDPGVDLPKGASVEFLEKMIGPEMGVTVIWSEVATSIPRLLILVKQGYLDAVLVLAKKSSRESFLSYPRSHFMETSPALAVLRDHPLKEVTRVEDILGLVIGYVHGAYRSPFISDQRITFNNTSPGSSIFMNFRKLVKGRIDAQYQPDTLPLQYYIRSLDYLDRVRIVPLPDKTHLYTAFSIRFQGLAERYDQAFEKVGGIRAYGRLISKHMYPRN